jgi:hypothetical protein
MQPSLLDLRPAFDGSTFSEPEDGSRLRKQLARVQAHMLMSDWQTLAEIEAATGTPQASASARLRDLRKRRFGSYLVERRRRSPGTYEYRVRSAA